MCPTISGGTVDQCQSHLEVGPATCSVEDQEGRHHEQSVVNCDVLR